MRSILHVEASPRGEASTSSTLAHDFLTSLSSRRSGLTIDTLNVWSEPFPKFAGATIDAKYAKLSGRQLDADQEAAWAVIRGMVARLSAADAILISTPMWNLGIPYQLKHSIDLVTQPGLSFSFDPTRGYTGLLQERPSCVILSSAGDFSKGPSYGRPDLASGYLAAALRFIGLSKPEIVMAGPTAGRPDLVATGAERARLHLDDLAIRLAGL